jgi:hypothetical protein
MAIPFQNHPARLRAVSDGAATFECEPCSNGHSSSRYVRTGICVECNALRNEQRPSRGQRGRPANGAAKHVARKRVKHTQAAPEQYGFNKAQRFELAMYESSTGRAHSDYLDRLRRKRIA